MARRTDTDHMVTPYSMLYSTPLACDSKRITPGRRYETISNTASNAVMRGAGNETVSRTFVGRVAYPVLESRAAAAVAAQGRKLMILSDFWRLCLAHKSLTFSAVILLPPFE